jgi:cell division septal protein FtsQ
MPPKSKKRPRRKAWRPNWGPILAVALLANVAAGLTFSPLTQIRKIRVSGGETWDRGRLAQLAGRLKRMPAARVDPRVFETAVLATGAVEEADFRRSLFGSAALALRYRVPVALIVGAERAFLSEKGVGFRSGAATKDLPQINLHSSLAKPHLLVAGGWPARPIAEMIPRIPKALRQKLVIDVDSEGAICFNTNQAARIYLGSADRLDEKLRTLGGMLSEKPNLLRQVTELNLIEPSRPVWKLRPGVKP